ncbi:MAG: DUF6443 domain-containing protein [Reichenbachiella sp.]|uniref:DUF6443 domain-containing protein n=1 Tax=Reichenbachiella sp. TaxID=2184521 RepID=UPI003262FC9F
MPLLAIGTGASRCGSGSVTISATTGGYGNEIKWYSASSGGSLLHTGGSYSPTVSSTTTYYAASHSTTTGCTDTDRVAVTATVDAVPTLYSVTGGVHCSTSGTLTVGLNGSQSGMEYQLYFNAAPVLVEGTSTIVKVFGTGSAVDFTYDADQLGTYTVYAVSGSCTTLMTGDAKIVTAPLPVTVSGGGSFCPGLAGVPVNLSSAESGVTYELFRNGTTTGQTTTTAGFGNQTLSGNYTVKASKDGCTIELAETIVVTTITPPTIPVDSVSTNTCGDKIIYAVDPPHASTNVFWKWQGNNSNGMSDDAFTSAGRAVDSTATYYVRAKDEGTGCWSASNAIAVTVNPLPATPVTSITEVNLCDTTRLTWDGTAAPGYTWYWQTDAGNTDTDPVHAAATYERTFGTTMFLKSQNDVTGCWSNNSLTVNYTIRAVPDTPFAPTTHDYYCDSAIIEYDSMVIRNKNWYWEVNATDTAHSATEFVMNMRERKLYTETNTHVRAYDEASQCWSPALTLQGILGPYPLRQYGSKDIAYCAGEVVDLEFSIYRSESDVTYEVFKDDVHVPAMDRLGDAQGDSLMWINLDLGTYKIVGDRNGCRKDMFDVITITENPVPTANGGSDITVFNSDITTLPFSEINGSAWTSSEATIANNLYNARLDGPGTYNLTYTFTNTAGCSDDDDVLMTVVADPDRIELTAGSRFINTDPQASILAPTLTAPAGYTYQWYKDGAAMAGKTANTLQPDTVGVYDVDIMTVSGLGVRSNAVTIVPLRATDNVNHITTRQLREAWTDENNLPIATDSVSNKLDFMDDLGRPMQTVIENQSMSGLDMVQPMAYDEFGRSPKAYLPYTSSVSVLFKNDAVDEQGTFYATTSGIAQDDFPYSENTFEASPLNRVLKTNAPGLAWAKTDTSAGKPVVFDFSANATGEVLKWEINSNALTRNGSYAAGVLSKTITTDENDKQVQEFKNLQGQVILKKVQVSETTPATDNDWYQTYYVYDDFNNLRYVLPPMAVQRYESEGQSTDSGDQLVTVTSNYEDLTTSSSAKMAFTSPALIHVNKGTTLEKGAVIYRVTAANATITLNGDFLSKWAFQYQYDNRQRMVMKQVPGADSVLMVYDERDRLVMTQDGNQRANDQWSFTKYDELNRPVLTGIVVKTGSSRATIQAEVDSLTGTGFYETYTGTGALMGYDGSGYPTIATANDLLTVTYYDNYGFTDDSHWTLGNFTTKPEARTLVTGSKVKVSGQTNWNEMITLYDTFFRVASSVSKDYQNNRDSLVNVYYSDVLPLVTKTTHIHVSALTNDTTTLVKDFVYDHADRLLCVTHKINDETAVVILENEYNELGELTTKKLNKEGAGQYSQEVDYQYNIRGWLTKINDPGVSDPGDYFAMQLKYDEAGQYNGNIGATSWKNPFEVATNSYAYGYDPVNRIKSAGYSTTASHGMDFDVAGITYDANGNILTLQRNGNHDSQAAQLFDDLDYDYVGNQLTKVTDASGKDTGFKDGANATNEYVYDANGNMISDANKGIDSIAYNHLNLPIKVEMNADGSNRIEYIYDAAGIKMAQLVYGADTLTKRTDYQGAFIYEDSVLQFIQHEEGRIVAVPGPVPGPQTYDYQYHLKDHLGNVRATFKTEIDTDIYSTTLESDSASVEELYFYNLDSVRVTYASANKTSLGDEAARVGQDSLHLVGPAIALSVVPGDTIDMEVWAYYEGGSGYSNTVTVNTFINALATAFGGSSGAGGESGSIFDGINDALVGGAGGVGGNSDTNVPGAYLSYILFDQNYKEIQSGYHEISSSASFAHEKLFLNDITITQAGYLYIYTSMQSKGTQPVYFDDMKVTHTHSPIVSKDDYYPFGNSFSSYSRAASTLQNFKYNSKEKIDALGIDWYHYGARFYDPALGRWHVIDQDAENYMAYTPYNYVGSNPIRRIDPDGNNGWDAVMGAAAALIDNASAGIINLRGAAAEYVTDASDFNEGQDLGDKASMAIAAAEIGTGGGMISGGEAAVVVGLAAEVPSAGTSTAVVAAGGASVAAGAGLIAHGGLMMANAADNLNNQEGRIKEDGAYAPKEPLPRKSNGEPKADPEATGPHTQLGTKKGRNGNYTQAREFNGDGQAVKDIDFTDHGRSSEHSNPHQHRYKPSETGGTPQRSKAEPLQE